MGEGWSLAPGGAPGRYHGVIYHPTSKSDREMIYPEQIDGASDNKRTRWPLRAIHFDDQENGWAVGGFTVVSKMGERNWRELSHRAWPAPWFWVFNAMLVAYGMVLLLVVRPRPPRANLHESSRKPAARVGSRTGRDHPGLVEFAVGQRRPRAL